ncbi:hypothetical protein [Colwellia echini]|uniref:Uncharacterized protein n=1 Tax=Colwellia echini TaxID=1982103 RepID=A0ABY3MX29_9GAMM|nr:hypothetical protein [Colwellia echini]TYK65768.1 hypothetical protein CWS31_008960 [Colwellia echini]
MTVISVPFSIVESNSLSRSAQPISMGCPFAAGDFFVTTPLVIRQQDGQLISCQISPLTYWHDGSVKWATIDFVVDINSNETLQFTLIDGVVETEVSENQNSIQVIENNNQLEVSTGVETFIINTQQGEPLSLAKSIANEGIANTDVSKPAPEKVIISIELTDLDNKKYLATVDTITADNITVNSLALNNVNTELAEKETHRKTVKIAGSFNDTNNNKLGVLFESTLTFFANTSYIKAEVTIHNPQAAKHPGGLWDLGDEGSILFKSLIVNIPVEKNAMVSIFDHISHESITCGKDTTIQQFSSGGVNWQSPVHKNAAGKVDIEKNGFVLTSDNEEHEGMRISPSISVSNSENTISAYVENFWQNFPKSISKQNGSLDIGLFPGSNVPDGGFELQGGEKKTHSLWVDFKSVTQNFNWVDKPLNITIAPKYIEQTAAFDLFVVDLKADELSTIIEKGVHGENNFFAKREVVDEFGWRNFGDLYADHETQGYTGTDIFVSHYNNQYDPIYGFIYQYLTTGNAKYFELANDLTQHVTDIDIYHTLDDKDEYNGGLFWHTDHYLDASTSTHRTFSKNHQAAYEGYTSGGGPGGQHCYTTGLKSNYLLTGNESAKKAALQLADWITYSFEGSNTFLAKLFAIKQSGNHGARDHILDTYPLDRGTGHYIIALLDAYDLTQDNDYLTRAFKVISRTFHPNDDMSLRNFENIEATWFYTVFLQAVGRFLFIKERMNQLDDDFYFTRDAMLHYANWMADNERPYLEQKDKLEFPNTTWAGQDLRKVGVLYMAHYYSPIQNDSFKEKAVYIHQHIITTLKDDIDSDYTRILVLLMQNIGFANYYQHSTSQNKFADIREYASPIKPNKWIKIAALLLKELSRLSIKKELTWLSLRSAKVAKLLGNKS